MGPGGLGAWEAAGHACGWLAGVEALCGPVVAVPFRTTALATHIWSQGSRCSEASRSGLGSLTKMSPLQVVDQMACAEGRPWTFRLSQQDRLSRASWCGERTGQYWAGGGQQAEAGLPRVHCPSTPCLGGRHPLTQSFMSCSVVAARRTGHLCRVLSGVYRAKECLASLSTGTSAVTSLRNTCRYCAQRADGRLSPGTDGDSLGHPRFHTAGPWALACGF